MTASLPSEVQQVFDRFVTTEFTTVDRFGQPICWPVTPYYAPGDSCIDVTTEPGYPKKALDARANPKVALLFSDPTGSGLDGAPQVLVQGTADVDKAPDPSKPLVRVHVRPERVYAWPGGDPTREPELFDAHMEEVRSGHDEEPEGPPAPAEHRAPVWHERMDELGGLYPEVVLSLVAPDGFPFSIRVPISVDRPARRVRIGAGVLGAPVQPGRACLTAHDHHPDFQWRRNFQVRGELVEEDGTWVLVPQRMVGGVELPPA